MENRQGQGRAILARDRVSFFFTRVDEADEAACLSVLSPEERQKAMAYRFERDRRLSVTARAQLRYLLSLSLNVPAARFQFAQGPAGKPEIRPGSPGEGVTFNISHSRGMVVSALASGPDLGVDVEAPGRNTDPDLARRFFAPEESRQIMAVGEGERQRHFLRFWTLKEAYLKALGLGLSFPLDSIAFDLSDRDNIRFKVQESPGGVLQFFSLEPAADALAAVAVRAPQAVTLALYRCIPFEGILPLDVPVVSSLKSS